MSNITENKLNTVLAAADITAINTAVTAITSKLPTGSLDEAQRANYKSIDVDNKVFVEKYAFGSHKNSEAILDRSLASTA